MKKALILCWFLCLQMVAFAQSENISNLWNEANKAYQNKQYEVAIDQYKAILAANKKDADLYYNLGNAYFKNQENGKAIVNYLKALQINPDLQQAEQNLQFVQSQLTRDIPEEEQLWLVKWFFGFANLLSANAWAWLALALSIGASLLYLKNKKNPMPHGNRWLITSVCFCLLCFALSFAVYQDNVIQNKAVVIRANTFLYEDSKKSKVKWNLPEGAILKLKKSAKADLLEVSMRNGISGWVEWSDVETL